MKQCFKSKRFGAGALARIAVCNAVVERYQKQNLRLTLRQLYYQLITQNVIPNEEKSYKTLGKLLSDARLAGLVDWDAIEDRVRQPRVPQDFESIKELVDVALQAYRLPRWAGQENYVELWVEKDALAGVLQPVAERWHITLIVNRGYSSSSAMYESAVRYAAACYEEYDSDDAYEGDGRHLVARQPYLLYLGDHDPSGEDMVRDVKDRLKLMGIDDLEVQKLALTMAQVERFNPPPNPTKLSDSRAQAYVAQHGASSWEVDALQPEVLQQIIETAIRELVDVNAMNAIKAQEERDKNRLQKAAEQF